MAAVARSSSTGQTPLSEQSVDERALALLELADDADDGRGAPQARERGVGTVDEVGALELLEHLDELGHRLVETGRDGRRWCGGSLRRRRLWCRWRGGHRVVRQPRSLNIWSAPESNSSATFDTLSTVIGWSMPAAGSSMAGCSTGAE